MSVTVFPVYKAVYRTAVVSTVLLLSASAAQAVPAFARKYQASCQTCHVAFPKLNTYGQAFRLLGYRLPGETEDQVKQPEVPLGAPAYKRVFPKAVWPGAVPSQIPLSLVAEFLVNSGSQLEGEMVEKVDSEFRFPSEVALVAAGTAGDTISYFGEIAFEREIENGVAEDTVAVEHLDVRLIRPIRGSMAFNVKIGSFQPELVSTFDHARRLTVSNYDSMFSVATANLGGAESVGGNGHGGAGIALPAIATGFELYGVVKGRFAWNAGVVNGTGPGAETFDGNSIKDVYGRLAYKWGGLALDGSNADTYAISSKNWREKSFSVGLFTYRGDGSGIFNPITGDDHSAGDSGGDDDHGTPSGSLFTGDPAPAFLESRSFSRTGFDFNAYYQDLNVFGALVEGEDDLFALAAADGSGVGSVIPAASGTFTYRSWFIEADAVLRFPWLHGAVRWENVDLPQVQDGREVADWRRATAALIGLVRANLKTNLEYTWDPDDSRNYNFWLGLAIGF